MQPFWQQILISLFASLNSPQQVIAMARLTQEQLLEIFNALKKEVQPYERGNIKARIDIEGKYDLWSEKPGMFVHGKVRDEVAFTALILQSNYVGFYFMPVYTNTEDVKSRLSPALLKLLKGKACFHVKAVDKELLKDIKQAMKLGYDEYKKSGWL
jgi:hypothetical protein